MCKLNPQEVDDTVDIVEPQIMLAFSNKAAQNNSKAAQNYNKAAQITVSCGWADWQCMVLQSYLYFTSSLLMCTSSSSRYHSSSFESRRKTLCRQPVRLTGIACTILFLMPSVHTYPNYMCIVSRRICLVLHSLVLQPQRVVVSTLHAAICFIMQTVCAK